MEQELTQANTTLPRDSVPTQRVINWGGVLKGVAIVGAVALVAVVALPAFTAIGGSVSTFIAETPALESIAAGVSEAAVWIGDSLTYGMNYVGGFLGSLGNTALEGLGLAGKAWVGAEGTTKAIGYAGAAATAAVAAHAAMPSIQSLQLVTEAPVTPPPEGAPTIDPNLLGQQATQSAYTHHSMLHDAAHAAHHAAEEADIDAEAGQEPPSKKLWSSKFAHKTAVLGSHRAAALASQSPRSIPQPAGSYGEQIAIDRANLEGALVK